MAKNIDFMGATFPDVPSIRLPQHEGGLVSFDDTSDGNIVASDVAQGKIGYAQGQKIIGTNVPPTGSQTITENGTYDVSSIAEAIVNVAGGGELYVDTVKVTPSSSSTTITFTGLKAEPKMFYVRNTTTISLTGTNVNAYVTDIFYNGTSAVGGSVAFTKSNQVYGRVNSSGYTITYSNGTLSIQNYTSTANGLFRTQIEYSLTYFY